jgi:glycosyltransferase involved in cell wall biosynthesis
LAGALVLQPEETDWNMTMSNPKVSVIIPAYNGASFLAGTIQSVLDQTYPHFELIVVDDASPDPTADVVGQFNDPRLKCLLHDRNKGAAIARRTGLHASSGDIIAYLDQDDLFHPEKLQRHVEVLEKNPEVGITYNSFFDLEHSSRKIKDIRRPPKDITLADLVLGFPIPPSSWVMRRNWAFSDEIWDENTFLHGAEIVHLGRLYLAGCKFAFVDKALQYRWYHAGRIYRDLRGKCEAELACQRMIFSDPRCPPDVLELQGIAFANIYLMWCNVALLQYETALAQELLRKVVELNPAMLAGSPCELIRQWVVESTNDENGDHQLILKNIFAQLPPELEGLSEHYEWAVGRGYLEKGARAIIWGRLADGQNNLAAAKTHGARVDEPFIIKLASWLMNYEHEFGAEATRAILGDLIPLLGQVGGRGAIRKLMGNYLLNDAFHDYDIGNYDQVPKKVVSAIANDPAYLANRGAISILFRSGFGKKTTSKK